MGDLYKMFKSGKLLKQGSGGGGGGGTSDYENLENLPSMNGHVIRGAMVSSDLDLPSIEDVESKVDASEMEQALQGKADKSTTYTKTEIDTAFGNVGAALGNKADKSTIYTKTEIDSALSDKQNTIDSLHKLSADLIDDTNATNKFATAAELEQIETNKNNVIELVDSGAKNIANWHDYTFTNTIHRGVSYTNNNNGTITVNTDSQGSTDDDAYANLITKYDGLPFDLKAGDTIVFASSSDKVSMVLVPYLTDHYGTSERGSKSSPRIYTIPQGTTGMVVRFAVSDSGTVVSNETVSAFICAKSAWDVSQKFVPYRPTYEETVEQVSTNKNNISIVDITSEITVTSGYTLSALSNVWKQGNHVWGQIIITLDSGEVAQTQTKVAQITKQYAPAKTHIGGCQLGGGLFDVRNNGYLFIRNNTETTGGEIIVTAYNSGNTAINIHVDYTI